MEYYLALKRNEALPQGHWGPCCPHGTSSMLLPWKVPPRTVSSREEVPVCSPHRKVQQASIKQLVAEMQAIVSSGPRSGGTPAEPGCAEACASGQMEYKPQTKVVQATPQALQEAAQGRGEGMGGAGRGRKGPEARRSWARPGRPCWRPHFTGAGKTGH